MNKYSNKPAKGYERIIQRFYEDLATLTIETFRPVSLICKFLLYFSILCSCRVSCGSPKYPAHNDMRRMNSICIKCRISCGEEMTKILEISILKHYLLENICIYNNITLYSIGIERLFLRKINDC